MSTAKVLCSTWPSPRICTVEVTNTAHFRWSPLDQPSFVGSIELSTCSVSLEAGRIELVSSSQAISIFGAPSLLSSWCAVLTKACHKSKKRRSSTNAAVVSSPPKASATLSGISFEFDEHYQPIKALGRGTFGYVISVRDVRSGAELALKKVHHAFKDRKDATRMLREMQVLRHMKHPNVLSIRDVLVPSSPQFDDVYFATPLMATDLQRVIKSSQPLGASHCKHIMYQLLCGLNYIHSAGVVHRDLKPANVLANGDCSIQICDFGLCRELDGGPLSVSVVTRWYRAPEILLGSDDYGTAVDMWSAGCILAELLYRRPFFPGSSSLDQMARILQQLGTPAQAQLGFIVKADARQFMAMQPRVEATPWQDVFPGADPCLLDLLSRLLQFDPRARLSAAEALCHPLFADIRDPRAEAGAASPFRFAHSRANLSRSQLRRLVVQEAQLYASAAAADAAASAAATAAVAASALTSKAGGCRGKKPAANSREETAAQPAAAAAAAAAATTGERKSAPEAAAAATAATACVTTSITRIGEDLTAAGGGALAAAPRRCSLPAL